MKTHISLESPLTMSRGVSFFPFESLELFRIVRLHDKKEGKAPSRMNYVQLIKSNNPLKLVVI